MVQTLTSLLAMVLVAATNITVVNTLIDIRKATNSTKTTNISPNQKITINFAIVSFYY